MKKKLKFLLVNGITTLRLLGVFLLVPIYSLYGGCALALTNIFCFLTDFADGKLSRKWKVSTFFGSLYDGFSDKAFVAMNLIILTTITPLTIIPILCELGIVGAQALKYKNNLNVQSNLIGKIKMWIAGITIVLASLFVNAEQLTFLGNSIVAKLASIENKNLVNITLIPLVISEIVTFISYIMELIQDKKKLDNEESKELEKEEVVKEEVKEEKDLTEENNLSIKEALFDHDFYEMHKNESGLKVLMRQRKKKL